MFIERKQIPRFSGFKICGIIDGAAEYVEATAMDWELDAFSIVLFDGATEASGTGCRGRVELTGRYQWHDGEGEHYCADDVLFGDGSFGGDRFVVYHHGKLTGVPTAIFEFRIDRVFCSRGYFRLQWSNRGIFIQSRGSSLVFISKDGEAGPRVISQEEQCL